MEKRSVTAFHKQKVFASGPVAEVALKIKSKFSQHNPSEVFVFDDEDAKTLDLNLRGSEEDVLERYQDQSDKKAGPGRPKLGVVSREVSLLPRHWEWLASQPGGASVTIRKLIEEAKKRSSSKDRKRAAQDATYRFMSFMGGDLPNFEEALRAFYAGDEKKFLALIEPWPVDIKKHTRKLASLAL